MKKTLIVWILLILFSILMSACAQSNEPETAQGNSNGNYNNSGMYVETGEWIFYSDVMNDYTLTKMNIDGSEKIALNEQNVLSLSFVDGWLYFAQMQENFNAYIFRMQPDGTEKQQLGTANCDIMANIIVVGDNIFFSNAADGSTLYTMKTDGSELTKLNTLASYHQTFENQWLYYISVSINATTGESNNQLRKIRADGSEDTLLTESVGSNALAYGGWVYYTTESGSDLLYKIKQDGSEKTLITNVGVSFINIYDNTLYYMTLDQGQLFSCSLDGSAPNLLTEFGGSGISIAEDWIYFMSLTEGGRLYRIKLDGTGLEKAYSSELVKPDSSGNEIIQGLGSINANLNGESKFVNQGDWIYFNIDIFSGPIKKINLDGSSETIVSEKAARCINLVGDWLYFIDSGFYNSLARVKTDGTNYGIILDTSCSELIVRDDWMYFTNTSEQNHLYKVKVDGTGLTQLCEDSAIGINLVGDWLYYSIQPEDGFRREGIFKVKTDGSGKTMLTESVIISMSADADWVYYSLEDPITFEYQLRRMKTDGSGDEILDDQALATLSGVYEGWLYYFNGAEEEGIIRMRPNGSEREVLIGPDNFVWVHFLGDKIIFYDNSIGSYRMMNLDGTGLTDLSL